MCQQNQQLFVTTATPARWQKTCGVNNTNPGNSFLTLPRFYRFFGERWNGKSDRRLTWPMEDLIRTSLATPKEEVGRCDNQRFDRKPWDQTDPPCVLWKQVGPETCVIWNTLITFYSSCAKNILFVGKNLTQYKSFSWFNPFCKTEWVYLYMPRHWSISPHFLFPHPGIRFARSRNRKVQVTRVRWFNQVMSARLCGGA